VKKYFRVTLTILQRIINIRSTEQNVLGKGKGMQLGHTQNEGQLD
jgi:hypothetical protein